MWINRDGLLRHIVTNRVLSPKTYGQPIYFENLGELYFSETDVVIPMSASEFDQFCQEYESALQC